MQQDQISPLLAELLKQYPPLLDLEQGVVADRKLTQIERLC